MYHTLQEHYLMNIMYILIFFFLLHSITHSNTKKYTVKDFRQKYSMPFFFVVAGNHSKSLTMSLNMQEQLKWMQEILVYFQRSDFDKMSRRREIVKLLNLNTKLKQGWLQRVRKYYFKLTINLHTGLEIALV